MALYPALPLRPKHICEFQASISSSLAVSVLQKSNVFKDAPQSFAVPRLFGGEKRWDSEDDQQS